MLVAAAESRDVPELRLRAGGSADRLPQSERPEGSKRKHPMGWSRAASKAFSQQMTDGNLEGERLYIRQGFQWKGRKGGGMATVWRELLLANNRRGLLASEKNAVE